ncbi:TolC family protein [Shewanella sp. VB17]|uniref:TolC family protein n=1 Tax=Shewanella sp. VB17 TaxID=2739432 RepID=UPI0015669B22|nr:TolC family protein [Shewanella sp. VB17]NRD72319.1 TolC family protein [Shewanella sp. VB17]
MKKAIIACLLLIYIADGALSAQAATAVDSKDTDRNRSAAQMPTNVQANFSAWLPALMKDFNALPEVRAQEARRRQAQLKISATDQAVYNPELGLGYQNASASEDTYSLNISQAIDWGDKRGVGARKAQLEADILLSDIALERSQMLANSVQALVEQSQMRKALVFQKKQFSSAKIQLKIAQQQMQLGDLSAVELQLIQLDVASKASDYAMAEQASITADANVLMLLNSSDLPFNGFFNALILPNIAKQIDPELPALRGAYQHVLLAKVTAEQVKAETSADPTISLNAEREGDDNKLGLGLSIPLQIRNNYSDTLAVASQEIAIAEQRYLTSERVLTQQQKKFNLSLPRLTERYQDWRELVLGSGQEAALALSQQWKSGDINTSDYLQSQRLLSSSYLAGLSLETALYSSWLEWMGASGQLETFLNSQLSVTFNNGPISSILAH